MFKRKPQPRCKCGHAKSQHSKKPYSDHLGIDYSSCCGFCWDKCLKFDQDNLATLERLHAFKEQKEQIVKGVSL